MIRTKAFAIRSGLSIVLVGLTALIFYRFLTMPSPDLLDETLVHREKWASYAKPDYAITVLQSWLPSPTRDRVLTFKNGIYVSQERDPSCKLEPATLCDHPLDAPEEYSIQALFAEARRCTSETKAVYFRLGAPLSRDFHGFASFDELLKFATSIETSGDSATLCFVQYDLIYGYPQILGWYTLHARDGAGTVQIAKLTFPKANSP